MASWQIRFDGTDSILSVEEFVFRVETMVEGENITDAVLAVGLHYLLTGTALTWYWLHKRRHRQISWQDLRFALIKEFQSLDSDYEVRKRADAVRQGSRESFEEFRLRM